MPVKLFQYFLKIHEFISLNFHFVFLNSKNPPVPIRATTEIESTIAPIHPLLFAGLSTLIEEFESLGGVIIVGELLVAGASSSIVMSPSSSVILAKSAVSTTSARRGKVL